MTRVRRITTLVLTACVVGPSGASATPQCPPGPTAAAETLCRLNATRIEHGRRPLRPDPRLARSAEAHARDMVARHFFAHTTPEGVRFSDRIEQTGWMLRRPGWSVGETLAWGTAELSTPEAIVRAWLESPRHRHVVLAARYHRVGIGTAPGVPVDGLVGGVTYAGDFGSR